MINKKRIIITGPSCAGKTTLGKRLAQELNIKFLDLDDFVWDMTTVVPYTKWYSHEEKVSRLKKALENVDEFVMVGSMDSFHEEFDYLFTYGCLLDAPDDLRLERFINRATTKYGTRVDKDGDMYEGHIRQIEIIKNYHKNIILPSYENHKKWLESLNIPILYLDGTDDIIENINIIKNKLFSIK